MRGIQHRTNLIPGASLHNELELLAEAGIRPLEVIEIATNNGAMALGIDDITGTIQSGKQADMIVLSANPIQNISNTCFTLCTCYSYDF